MFQYRLWSKTDFQKFRFCYNCAFARLASGRYKKHRTSLNGPTLLWAFIQEAICGDKQNFKKQTKAGRRGNTSFFLGLPLRCLAFWEHRHIWKCSCKAREKKTDSVSWRIPGAQQAATSEQGCKTAQLCSSKQVGKTLVTSAFPICYLWIPPQNFA